MIRLGNCYIDVSNNWRKIHGFPLQRGHKRYPHESRKMPKTVRIKYHHMKKVGCDNSLIARYLWSIFRYPYKGSWQ